MMPTWPAPLPDSLLRGYRVTYPDQVLRSPMTSGRAKTRPRSRYIRKTIAGSIDLKTHPDPAQNQVKIWEDFFFNDLAAGALAFDWTDPDDGTQVWFEIMTSSEPTRQQEGTVHILTLTLGVLP